MNIPGEYFQHYQKQYTARYLAPGANLPPPDSAHARDTDVAATSVRDLVSTAARTQILGNRGRDWELGINDEITKTTKISFVTCVFFLPEKRVMHLQESQGGRVGSSASRGVFFCFIQAQGTLMAMTLNCCAHRRARYPRSCSQLLYN